MDPRDVVLDADCNRAVDALTTFFVTLRDEELGDLPEAPPHIVARAVPHTAPAAERAWALGSLLLRRALNDANAPSSAELHVAEDVLNDSVSNMHGALEGVPPSHPRGSRAIREARQFALEDVDLLLEEIGFEEFNSEVALGTLRDGARVILAVPVDADVATIRLLDPVLAFLEVQALADEVLTIERDVCTWWFERWSAVPRNEAESYEYGMREREFTLVDRTTIALGDSVASVLFTDDRSARLPPRQRALLGAVTRSVCSVFIIRERRGAMIAEDVVTGASYMVHEHEPEIFRDAGFLGAGRLIPIDGGAYVRSPGMVLWEPSRAGVEGMREHLVTMAAELGTSIAVETVIATLTRGVRVPRDIRPASSRKDAREALYEFNVAMEEAGLAERVDTDDIPPELRALAESPSRAVLQMPMDGMMAAWTLALLEQSGVKARTGDASPKAKKRKKAGKQGKRRKR